MRASTPACSNPFTNSRAKPVGVLAEAGYVFKGITGSLPGPEGRTGNINGIGPAVNGCEADIFRSGWSQQFQRFQITGS